MRGEAGRNTPARPGAYAIFQSFPRSCVGMPSSTLLRRPCDIASIDGGSAQRQLEGEESGGVTSCIAVLVAPVNRNGRRGSVEDGIPTRERGNEFIYRHAAKKRGFGFGAGHCATVGIPPHLGEINSASQAFQALRSSSTLAGSFAARSSSSRSRV